MKTLSYVSMLMLVAAEAEAATVSGRVQVAGRPPAADVTTIVYAEPLDGARVEPGTFALSQRNKTFSPRVLPVPVGSTVQFPNDDLIFHNVFSLSRPGPFDLGLYRAGSSRSRSFRTPTIYRVFCNIHPQMTAIVLVVPTSYFTQTDRSGGYRIELPAGRYRITAWSERSQPTSADIALGANPVAVQDLRLDESQYVELGHRNKFGVEYASLAYDPVRDRKPR